jgi:NAD-dependent deacetylase
LRAARALVEGADRVVVLTGAGMSAESGVPTFRGEAGLWKSYRPEELATPGAFRRDPALVWEWYRWRRDLVRRCRPNAGHLALAAFAARRPETRIVTQNVDGLHDEAARMVEEEVSGSGGAPPLELHGALFGDRCSGCGHRSRAPRSGGEGPDPGGLPCCDACGALLRPDVVWFGEGLDPEVLDRAVHAASSADLCLVVGTSAVVQPAASVPLQTLRAGGDVVEVNPDETPLSPHCRAVLRGPSGEILPTLLAATG